MEQPEPEQTEPQSNGQPTNQTPDEVGERNRRIPALQ